jgi:hypothetical protein
MKHLTITLAFLMTLSTQANSGIVADRDSWNKMDLVLRFGYVMGVWDTITLNLVGEPERARSYKDKLFACGNEMELALSFVDIVNEYYADEKNLNTPPNIALDMGLKKFCDIEY